MNTSAFKEISRLVPVFLVVLAVAIGARFVSSGAIDEMVQDSAEIAAVEWAQKITRHVPNLQNILAGENNPSEDVMRGLEHRQPSEIQAYRIYDASGQLRFEKSGGTMQFDVPTGPNRQASQFVSDKYTGQTIYDKVQISNEADASLGSRTITPLSIDGNVVGSIEVLSEETESYKTVRKQFSKVTFQFTALMLAAFLLPAILYLLRTDQLESASKRLRHSAEYDELTGVLNRSALTKIMDNDLVISSERGYSIAVHFIDLDRFKVINDTRGHKIGDRVLSAAAHRLKCLIGPRDHIARLGGDEFAIFQPYFVGSSSVATGMAEKIIVEMNRPFETDGVELQVGASVGYSHFPRDGKTVSELLRTADLALYCAKDAGRGRAQEFDPSMEEERQSRQLIEQLLRTAVEDERFNLNFQPFYDLKTGELRGFEALLRINDHKGNPISPEMFIPIAEEIGLIGDIGEWVLRESCRVASNWPDDKIVSVNLSPDQFQTHSMPDLVREVLKSSGLPPQRLELEVTEGLLITDTDKVLSELLAIKDLGVSVALDDFGTGYSSLSYLWQFPFDKLKVDKSFINTLGDEGNKSQEILSTIIALGKVLDLKVTAEGVETVEQAQLLKSFDCDLVQGYLYSRPLNAVDVAAELIKSLGGNIPLDKNMAQKRSA